MGLQKYFKIFNYHGGGYRGFKRCLDTFVEVDTFDFKRGLINTRHNVRDGYENPDYMFYAPVYSSVLEEILYLSHDYWASAVRYTNYGAKAVFVDLGCGSGKTLINAFETNRYDRVYGVELLQELSERCRQNISKVKHSSELARPIVINKNVEDPSWANEIKKYSENSDVTLFIFNKNSYSAKVLKSTLSIAENHFKNIVYLYQNPVHSEVLEDNGYKCFASDSKAPNEHKNYKYKLYIKQVF